MTAYRKGFSWAWTDAESFFRHAGLIAGAGFHGLEPVFGGPLLMHSPERTAAAMRAECASLGLSIPSMRGGRYFWETISSPDKTLRDKGFEYGLRALDTLNALGGSVLLVVPGGKRADVPYEEHWKFARDFFLRLGEEACQRGLRVGAENVECGFPLSVMEWNAFLADISGPATGMYFDAGNVVWLDYGFPDHWIRSLASRILQIHFKGAVRAQRVCSLLEGDVDWQAVMRALADIRYEGWIIVEPPALPSSLLQDASDTVLRHYFTTLAADMEVIFQLNPAS
ncbi:sugar phosphate isomerase/epimerase [Desulfovibrio sp. OttesenSCG-928-I05]|nr:sugar phosphate isomerase/epimerase [Desulfovibrio sp. OttesenSCG-928-I05]